MREEEQQSRHEEDNRTGERGKVEGEILGGNAVEWGMGEKLGRERKLGEMSHVPCLDGFMSESKLESFRITPFMS